MFIPGRLGLTSSCHCDAIPSCPHALSWTVLRTYVSYPLTRSPDALFSIILKPPTGVLQPPTGVLQPPTDVLQPPPLCLLHTASVFSCSVFTFGVFQNADSAFFYPRPVVLNTDQGFPEHRPVFSLGFRHRTQAIPLVLSVPIRVASAASNHEVRLWSEADTGHNSNCMHIFG